VYPFERFTEDAKRTLTLAQEEAERSRHSYIGTEHLLLGLLRGGSGSAHRALETLGIAVGPVRELITKVLARNERIIIQRIIPTSRVKKVIEISFDEAHRMGHAEVDTGHLLIGLVIEGDGIGAHVLHDLGATRERVIAAAERELPSPQGGSARLEPVTHAGQTIDPQRFRDVMSSFPSGVVVLTAFGEDGLPRGLTVSAFCAVSLEPPLALACIDKTSNTLPAVQRTGGFTANILAAGREQLARRMASKASDKFDAIKWRRPAGDGGGPILEDDAVAYAVCTLKETIEAGDHWILIGHVLDGAHREGIAPLIFSRRGYFDS
jgi:flavin reductase (DIM6/NTAB) family NADH-FMN oxidoreductase RutF